MIYDYFVNQASELLDLTRRGKIPHLGAVSFQRTVSKGLKPFSEKSKRIVIAPTKVEAIIGKQWLPGVMKSLKGIKDNNQYSAFAAWFDKPYVDMVIQEMLEVAESQGLTVVSGDISSYDQSFHPNFLMDIARIIGSWVKGYEKIIPNMVEALIYNTTLITPSGVISPKPHTLFSGSIITNLGGTSGNKIVKKMGEELGMYSLLRDQSQGDDFAVVGQGVTPDTMQEIFGLFGFDVSATKQLYEPRCVHYLQNLHVLGSLGGMASDYRVLGSALVYERMQYNRDDYNPYMEAVQTISKLENAAFSPWFEVLVNFIANNDKYKLYRDIPHAIDIIRRGGEGTKDMLARTRIGSINKGIMIGEEDGFSRATTNGVLRGELLPPIGSRERFLRVYGKRRIDAAL